MYVLVFTPYFSNMHVMIEINFSGLADPYVKGQLGFYRFRTRTHKKTLLPKWQEEFKIPICSWEAPNILVIEVRDKDTFVDDTLGYVSNPLIKCHCILFLGFQLSTCFYLIIESLVIFCLNLDLDTYKGLC